VWGPRKGEGKDKTRKEGKSGERRRKVVKTKGGQNIGKEGEEKSEKRGKT